MTSSNNSSSMRFNRYHRSNMIAPSIASFLLVLLLALLSSFQQAHGISLGIWEHKYEGEAADEYSGADKVNDKPTKYTGYTGNGYADFGGKGSYVEWNVETSFEQSDYELSVRYSAPNQRSCYLYVDNIKRGDYSIDSTGSWNKWEESKSITVSLGEGIHKIKIVAVGDSGPNIDFLSISSSYEIVVVEEEEEPMISDEIVVVKKEEPTLSDEVVVVQEEIQKEEKVTNSFLTKDISLSRGQFIMSPNGLYVMGLVGSTGELVIMDNTVAEGKTITWSNGVLGGELIYMQVDGNLVVQNGDSKVIWNTESSGNNGAQLTIDDTGTASIVLYDSTNKIIWTTIEPGTSYDSNSDANASSSTNISNKALFGNNPNSKRFAEKVVLNSLEKLPRGKFVSSPSDNYNIGLNNAGDLILQDSSNQRIIWNANVKGCATATMQPDGNFVLRDDGNKLIWTTHTSKNPGARLVVDDGGRLSVMVGQTAVWMEGIPRGVYNGTPSSHSLQFPLRGIFYYPWYPETWSVNSKPVKFVPDLGKYSSDDKSIVEEHVDAMEYSYSDVAIASWWGPGTSQELSRISLLMDKTTELKSSIKWTVYYEDEMFRNPSVEKIRSDLDYLKKWFVWHPAWTYIDDKPVIFVYNESGCNVNERWMEATGNDWYVVLKVFPGRDNCEYQPDSYHQYGPSTEYSHIKGVSTTVSPGFWRADKDEPNLARVPRDKFCENTRNMVESGEDWQLVTTFNEAGEGTLVEASSDNWGSDTKYGYYLDCLHDNH